MLLVAMMAAAPAQAGTRQLAIIRGTPEPASLLLSGTALIAIGVALKKKKHKRV